jgi:aromatic ring-opening dioxygenase LigB subunit
VSGQEEARVLVYGCIAPHGAELLEELTGPAAPPTRALRAAMAELAADAARAAVDRWVVLTPHGVRVDGAMAVADCARAFGRVEAARPGLAGIACDGIAVDRDLAAAVARQAAARGLPVARTSFGGSVGEGRTLPLDWGTLVPYWWVGRGPDGAFLPMVPVSPSRLLSWEDMVTFGEAVGKAAAESPGKVGILASSDLAHTHQASGPYGFAETAALYDRTVKEAVSSGDLMRLLAIDPAIVDSAKPDGQWQILILAGAMLGTPLRPRLLAYAAPTYFGMLCASCA